ncbi:MAG: hemagglutinin repeat-containing protein [Halobacteriales archaeon]|nr:hemagglutinin repeat-containing protein [Halobacteriales archaeon]
MARRRSRSRKRSRVIGPTGLLLILLAASAVVGASVVPTSSFSLVEAGRGSSVDVVSDQDGAVGLNTAGTVNLVGQSPLVTVTNNLGVDDVDFTVELLDHTSSQLTAGTNSGSPSLTFTLDAGQSQQVVIDATGPPGPLTYEVRATAAGVTAEMQRTTQVIVPDINLAIDIRPGDPNNVINPQSQQTVPVAIFNTTDFDPVNDLDRSTIRFGATGVPSPGGAGAAPQNIIEQDVDNDGDLDLFILFKITNAGFQTGSTQGEVVATTTNGAFASGTDSVTIVGPPGGGGGSGGPGQAFEDVNQNGQFDQGTDVLIPTSDLTDGKYDAKDNALVIPSGVGSLTAQKFDFKAEGVTIGVDLTATGGDIKIDSKDGDIDTSGVSLSATTKVELKTKESVDISDASISANREVKVDADEAITATNAVLEANEKIELKSKDDVDLTGADVSANREVKVDADGLVTISGAQVDANEKVEVKTKSAVSGAGATLSAGREVKIDADGSVTLTNAQVDANEKVEIKTKDNVDASGATITSGRELKIDADGTVSLASASLEANDKLEIKAEGAVSGSGATLDAGREVKVDGDGSVAFSGADIEAGEKIEIKAKGSVDLATATLDAGREIKIDADGSVSAQNATMTAGQTIEIKTKGTQDLSGATVTAPQVKT